MNQPTEPYLGPGRSLYGSRGPVQAAHTGRQQEPQSVADHVDAALRRVKGLGPQQRLAVHNEMVRMLRDIGVIKMVHDQLGPVGKAVTDEGRLL
jgi:hypothetical protein